MRPIARLIDANANRCREGLRVMEDLARFALDDASLGEACKNARHELAAAVGVFDAGLLLSARDTPGDVGTETTTAGEAARPDAGSVAAAAGGRASEALRVLEEGAKLEGVAHEPFERLRYAVYELDRRLRLALGAGTGTPWTLCVLITSELCAHHAPERVAELAIAGGADCIQLREKSLRDRELLARARAMRELTRGRAGLVINDRPDVAVLAEADGVHFGQTDLPVAEARRIVGFGRRIGVSCSTLEQARAAAQAGADDLGLGPMFVSETKPKPVLSGAELIRRVVADPVAGPRPHLAISGVDASNAGELARAGCRGVAVCGAICGAADPAAAARAILEALAAR
ncbi:MAG: thiamine phosphate synthase [Phycisphaerales bacterium]|nr:MAG: thiamine phosphate synthase [Phycisphaerales bacterium]